MSLRQIPTTIAQGKIAKSTKTRKALKALKARKSRKARNAPLPSVFKKAFAKKIRAKKARAKKAHAVQAPTDEQVIQPIPASPLPDHPDFQREWVEPPTPIQEQDPLPLDDEDRLIGNGEPAQDAYDPMDVDEPDYDPTQDPNYWQFQFGDPAQANEQAPADEQVQVDEQDPIEDFLYPWKKADPSWGYYPSNFLDPYSEPEYHDESSF